ncbi:MAG: 1-deoxy-D-xylulose-5-phosphate reductoisomerase [Flavobacteriales bacterium]|nr:1-deoxy-D-xylulose-5-phosphate reductoisomerase [Flavobacteriales bacterium]
MLNETKKLAILGSTGSIGTQTLHIVKNNPHLFKVFLLSAHSNYMLLFEQAKEFTPKHVVINTLEGYEFLKKNLNKKNTKVSYGVSELSVLVAEKDISLVVNGVVGSAGLIPTIHAIKAKKNIALANKETLVVAGQLIMSLAKKHNVSILPIDSEHSAIFQCLVGEKNKNIHKLILTASGGPFLNVRKSDFKHITIQKALKHPNWEMGRKITIDSATLMNKGLEVIEAYWLFGVSFEKINVVIHPESIIHSLVEFCDGSTKAQMGVPEMTTPILYALGFPERIPHKTDTLDLTKIKNLSFFKPDIKKFPHLKLAYDVLKIGGTAPCALNAANEVCVEAFLNKKIKFIDMVKIIEKSLENFIFVAQPKLDDYLRVDNETRKVVNNLISKS